MARMRGLVGVVVAVLALMGRGVAMAAEEGMAATPVAVQRLAQFREGDNVRGSHGAAMNMLATGIRLGADGTLDTSGGPGVAPRRVAVVRIADASAELVDAVLAEQPGGVVIVLPAESEVGQSGDAELAAWHALEKHLMGRYTKSPVYFAFDNERLEEVLESFDAAWAGAAHDSFHLTVNAQAAKSLQSLHGRNLQGLLHGAEPVVDTPAMDSGSSGSSAAKAEPAAPKTPNSPTIDVVSDSEFDEEFDDEDEEETAAESQDEETSSEPAKATQQDAEEESDDAPGDDATIPTIALVAHYDSFSAAPHMAGGADSNGSGAAALLEIARLFSRLYSSVGSRAPYNLLFLLSSGGKQNFAGTRNWLQQLDARVLNNIDFAVCLDSIGAGERLYMHTSKKEKTPAIKNLFSHFRDAAARLDVPLEIKHQKISISKSQMAWEHEHIALEGVTAFTFSGMAAPSPGLAGTSLLDIRSRVDVDTLARNTRVVAEALAAYMYDVVVPSSADADDVKIFDGSLEVDINSLAAWVDTLSASPRSLDALSWDDNVVVDTLYSRLRHLSSESHKQSFKLDTEDFVFYQVEDDSSMTVSRVKPASFDLIFMAGALAYLGVLYAMLKGPSATFKQVMDVLNDGKAKSS